MPATLLLTMLEAGWVGVLIVLCGMGIDRHPRTTVDLIRSSGPVKGLSQSHYMSLVLSPFGLEKQLLSACLLPLQHAASCLREKVPWHRERERDSRF